MQREKSRVQIESVPSSKLQLIGTWIVNMGLAPFSFS